MFHYLVFLYLDILMSFFIIIIVIIYLLLYLPVLIVWIVTLRRNLDFIPASCLPTSPLKPLLSSAETRGSSSRPALPHAANWGLQLAALSHGFT